MTDHGRKFFGFEPGEHIDFSKLASLGGRVHPDDRVARATAIQRALDTRSSFDDGVPGDPARWLGAMDLLARSTQSHRK